MMLRREGENWFIMINTSAHNAQGWQSHTDVLRARVIQKINKYLSLEIEKHIEHEHVRSPLSLQEETGAFRGALYGSNSNSIFSAFLRHPNFSSKIKHLYFTGGTVHPGGGIPLCLQSAKITSEIIKKDLNL